MTNILWSSSLKQWALFYFYFFLISNKNILLKEEKYNWSIQEGIHQGPSTNQEHKVQKSKNPWTENKSWAKVKEWHPNTTTQSRRVLKKKSLKSNTIFSKSSKCRLFLSRQNGYYSSLLFSPGPQNGHYSSLLFSFPLS